MKKILFSIVVAFAILLGPVNMISYPLFHKDGNLTYACQRLCKVMHLDLVDAHQFTKFFQANFLRPKGMERWEEYDLKTNMDDETFANIIKTCKMLRMTGNIYPRHISYDYIVIFGSNVNSMTKECEFVKNELMEVIANNPNVKVFFLTGTRPLDNLIDSNDLIEELHFLGLEATETEAAKLIFARIVGPLNYEIVNVDPSELSKFPNELKRPNTRDTIEKLFRDFHLRPGSMLAVATNPFISYQDNVMRNLLQGHEWFDRGGTLETAGYCLDIDAYCKILSKKQVVNILLDNITRCAYEEIKQVMRKME
jgi:hypothetical protein